MFSTAKGSAPLYAQIRDLLIARINDGDWPAGTLIPSEIDLAQQLGVSQGTVRKAIGDLVESNVFTRRQGKGTYVTNHDQQREQFHFLHLVDSRGEKVLPESVVLSVKSKRATHRESSALRMKQGSRVKQVERIRYFEGEPSIFEVICLPDKYFKGFARDDAGGLPNLLYEFYETHYGITIHSAREQIRAVAASARDAKYLDIALGAPLLEIERVALTLDEAPVELRTSRCSTEKHHYYNTIV